MQNTSAKHFPFILIIIFGVMTTFGPLSIDMYSPSLPMCNMLLVQRHLKFN